MRYMMLIYSKPTPGGMTPEQREELIARHTRTIAEGRKKGVMEGAEPLAPVSTATTVRVQDDKTLVTDGPFAETKEQLAGYYIIDCENLDDAIEWAAKIPTGCRGNPGCIEIRPLPGLPVEIGEPACRRDEWMTLGRRRNPFSGANPGALSPA